MAQPTKLSEDLIKVLAAHGVMELPKSLSEVVGGPTGPVGPSVVASYCKEIVTGAQAFDEEIISKVGNMLNRIK